MCSDCISQDRIVCLREGLEKQHSRGNQVSNQVLAQRRKRLTDGGGLVKVWPYIQF
jgi:hypothetical protein